MITTKDVVEYVQLRILILEKMPQTEENVKELKFLLEWMEICGFK